MLKKILLVVGSVLVLWLGNSKIGVSAGDDDVVPIRIILCERGERWLTIEFDRRQRALMRVGEAHEEWGSSRVRVICRKEWCEYRSETLGKLRLPSQEILALSGDAGVQGLYFNQGSLKEDPFLCGVDGA